MSSSIKTISDKAQFPEIFSKYFSKSNVYIKTKNGNIAVQYLGYLDDNVAFRIPRIKSISDKIVVYTRNDTSTYYLSLKLLERNEDTFIFLPVLIQVITEARQEERKEVDGDRSEKKIIYLSNIISDFSIKTGLTMSEKKLDGVKEVFMDDIRGNFEINRIVFVHEAKNDPRMKYFLDTKSVLLIENTNEKPKGEKEKIFNFYMNEIYSRDFKLMSNKELISEASVPLLYRGLIPYGYIQANNRVSMNESDLSALKKYANSLNEHIKTSGLFHVANEKFLVSDISKKGIGIAYKDRRLTRYFREGSRSR
ncbi:MAG: hypothetical protein MUD12_04545 [Spirochaetes bacterium]|nr:hypothetical protein [Spirochaetota bacterium]